MELNNNFIYKFEAKSNDNTVKKYAILKPNRKMREDGELFYSIEVSKFAKAGILPKAAWSTILSDGGGSISEKDRELYGNLLINFRDKSFELQSILIKNITDRTEEEKQLSENLIQELEDIKKDIQAFEASQISIFDNTAEAKARNKSILWWVLNLSYEYVNDQFKPIFDGDTFNKKLDIYDSYEENYEKYDFLLGVLRRFTYLITLWFLGRAEKEEDFKYFDDLFLQENKNIESKENITEEKINEPSNEKIEDNPPIDKKPEA